jgi:hemerythrin
MPKNNSNCIVWSGTFSCGIKLIDDQHKELVNLVNDMYNHVSGDEKQEREYLNGVLRETIKYIKVHFATEEKILAATRYAGYLQHKRAHEDFILAIADNAKGLAAGRRLNLLSFTNYLKEWIMSHVAVMDKQYFNYFKIIATRKTNGKLSITSEDVKNI